MQAIEAARQARQAVDARPEPPGPGRAARSRTRPAPLRPAGGPCPPVRQRGRGRRARRAMPKAALEDLAPASGPRKPASRRADPGGRAPRHRLPRRGPPCRPSSTRRRCAGGGRNAIAADIRLWTERAERAAARRCDDLGERLERAQERAPAPAGGARHLPDAPPRPDGRDRGRPRPSARKRPTTSPTARPNLAETDRPARAALEALSAAREARAGSQARHEAAVAAPRPRSPAPSPKPWRPRRPG